ncbi:MAG: hypothetical protein HY594_00330 [Candidatus Omnitrophica bacterium]|nr:hypothetical protein [Candidatus Omnitrophota bacterium]
MMTHSVAPLLVAAAAGYWVVARAQEQKGGTRKLGIYLGAAIIVLSVLMAACKLYCAVTCMRCPLGGGYGMKRMAACPITGKAMPAAPAEQSQ